MKKVRASRDAEDSPQYEDTLLSQYEETDSIFELGKQIFDDSELPEDS